MQFKRGSAGFTLVELILTVVILATIAAVAIPKFFNQSTFDERFFFDDTLAAARYASKLAIASGCSVRFSVNSSGFQLDQDSNCDFSSPNFSISVQRPDDNSVYSNTDVPDSVTVTASEGVLIYRPNHQVVNGSGSVVNSATIQLVGEVTRVITIYGNSGYAVSN